MPVHCRPRFPSRNRRFPESLSFPPTVPAQLSAAAACYYGKNYSILPCRRLKILYPCPTGTPTHCALLRQRRDLIIATRPAHHPYPRCCQRQRRRRPSSPRTDNVTRRTNSAKPALPNLHLPAPRQRGSLDRRSKWFFLVTFFLQKRKVTRAGARNAPSPPAGATPARRRSGETPPTRQKQTLLPWLKQAAAPALRAGERRHSPFDRQR